MSDQTRKTEAVKMKPTLEEYEELGRELSFICFRLSKVACELGNKTGVSKKPYMLAREADRMLNKCKSEAEELMFLQYPELGREACKVFYGEIKLPRDLQQVDTKTKYFLNM